MNYVISIERQYGSGGRAIGKKLSSELDISFYDSELLALAAQKSGFVEKVFEQADERPTNSFLYSLVTSVPYAGVYYNSTNNVLTNDKIFQIQSDVIRQIAKESSCVIVGRCSDHILRSEKNLIKIFLYANMQTRTETVMNLNKISQKSAQDLIQKTDKQRSHYYSFYTSKNWGDAENYDICLDTSISDLDTSVNILKHYVETRLQ